MDLENYLNIKRRIKFLKLQIRNLKNEAYDLEKSPEVRAHNYIKVVKVRELDYELKKLFN